MKKNKNKICVICGLELKKIVLQPKKKMIRTLGQVTQQTQVTQ
jgi:hypothetical protein